MEDACIHNLNFDDGTAFFGVFDGHGGKEASYVVRDHLERIVKEDDHYKNGDFEKALYDSFCKMDDYLDSDDGKSEMKKVALDSPETKSPLMKLLTGGGAEEAKQEDTKTEERSEESFMLDAKGCTANVILIKDNIITVANAGDSRCVIASDGRAEDLSEDHKPENEIEKARIQNAGSEITDGRVDGNLNLSRSLGDLKHKQKPGLTQAEQPITCVPDTKTRNITPADDFIIMA